MQKFLRAGVAGLLIMGLLLAGCGKKADTSKVVAEVDGVKITRNQLDVKVGEAKTMFEAQGFDFSNDQGVEMLVFLEQEMLNQMIQEVVIKEEAENQGLGVSAGEIEENLDKMKEPYGEETFKNILKEQNLTEDSLKQNIEFQILADRLFDKVTAEVEILEAEVEKYFQENQGTLVQYKASHILIKPEDDQEASVLEAKNKAEELVAQLDNGADFAELATANSADGSAASGGSLGQYFTKDTSPYVEEFTEAILKLEEGRYTEEPVKTDFGYHIIKLDEKLDTFAELKDNLQAELEKEEKNKVFYDYFTKLIDKAEIVNNLAEEAAVPEDGKPTEEEQPDQAEK